MIRFPSRATLHGLLALALIAPLVAAQQEQEPPPAEEPTVEEPAVEQQAPGSGEPAPTEEAAPAEEPAEQQAPGEGEPAPAEGTVPAEEAPPPIIDVTEVASRSNTAGTTLDRIEEEVEPSDKAQAAAEELDALHAAMADGVFDADQMLGTTNSMTAVEEVDGTWSAHASELAALKATFDARAETLKKSLDELDALAALWKRSLEAFDAEAPEAAVSGARGILDRALALREQVLAARDRVVTTQSLVAETSASIEKVQKNVSSTRKRLQRELLSADAPPLWVPLLEGTWEPSLQPLVNEWSRRVDSLEAYARKRRAALLQEAALVLAVLILLLVVRRQAAEWIRDDPNLEKTTAVLRHPLAGALLVALLFSGLIHTREPVGLTTLHGLVAIVAVYSLLAAQLTGRAMKGLVFASLLFLLDMVRGFLWNDPVLERGVFVLEALLATLAVVAVIRHSVSDDKKTPAIERKLLWVALATLVGALFCLIIGYVGMGRLLTKAVILCAWGAYAILAIRLAAIAVVNMGLRTKTVGRLKMVSRHRPAIRRRLDRLIVLVTWLLYASFVLKTFTIRATLFEAVGTALSTPLEWGSLSVSLGDVLAFGFVLWFSFQVSKFLRFVFQEDIATRLKLPRGVPYAASSAMHYLVLFIGFIVAIQVAGVDMSRFAIIGGALGVGVGFGLQNVVNNFVSGLILLFERPIQVGDTVEVGTVFGIVRRIGIRSSTVRTWDGAEVIVPNGDLISNQVTNWTLSDMQRRVIVPIGVAYGTDPERVIEMLLDLAKNHPDVISDPEPMAIFTAHGASSLDFELRAWTVAESPVRLKSELTSAVNKALAEADIEIPFPQRDLHLRSSDVALGGAKPGGDTAAAPPDRPVIPDTIPDGDEPRA